MGGAAGAQQPADDAALQRRARLLRIEDTQHDEPAYLDSLLQGAEPRGRAEAALAAGRIGARDHAPRLRALASDADTTVAASALFALGLIKDTASLTLGAGALRAAPSVALEGAWLLGELGERGRPAIVAALRDSSLSPASRGALLLAASRLRPVPADAIVPWVTSGDSAVAWRAAYALARGRSAAGVRGLLDMMTVNPPVRDGEKRPSREVLEQVARGLGRSVAGDSLRTRAQAVLAALAMNDGPRVRVNAVRSLASYGGEARGQVLLALQDRDASVRLTAAQALGQVLDSSATAWAHAFAIDTAFVMQRTIADAAARRGIAIEATRPWRNSSDWQRRAAVVELDAHGPAVGALFRLTSWRDDRNGRVRAAAAGAIAALVDSPSVRSLARDALRTKGLSDRDVGVRTAALGGLASGASEGDLLTALDTYAVAQRDADNDARLAFWQLADSALARANGAIADSTARRLDALPRPVDPLERIAASRIARFTAWRDSTSTARAMDWYLARVREARSHPRPVARLETDRGTIELALYAEDAPLTVHNFVTLSRRGYFDRQRFHRVVPNFVVQGGDPRGDGNGGPGYAIRDEMNRRQYLRGTLGMALSGPDTGGSQFFVTHSPQPHLDGGYTVFGQLLSGGEVLDRIVQGDRLVRITIR